MTAAQLLLFIGLVVALVYQFACRAGRKSGGKALAAKARESSGAPPSRSLYPASEGFFAIADRGPGEGLRLIVDNGLFYEFVLLEAVTAAHPERRWLADAVLGTEYALVVSSCAGLWAYVVADTVRLIMRDPPRLLVTGQLSYFLSAFGQHLSGEEIETAVSQAAEAIGVAVADFAVGALWPRAAADWVMAAVIASLPGRHSLPVRRKCTRNDHRM